jgi:hypothetical protein
MRKASMRFWRSEIPHLKENNKWKNQNGRWRS